MGMVRLIAPARDASAAELLLLTSTDLVWPGTHVGVGRDWHADVRASALLDALLQIDSGIPALEIVGE